MTSETAPAQVVHQLRDAMREPVMHEPSVGARRASRRRRGRRKTAAAIAGLVLLVVAVPVLTWYGLHLVFATRGGRLVSTVNDPHAPGYLALVTPTPTELVIEVDGENHAVSLTLLSLTMQDHGGGTLVFIPLDTAVPVPAYGIDRLRTAYRRGGATALASATSQVLGIGFSEVVTVDPEKFVSLVQPVAPLSLDNPDRVVSDVGDFSRGPISLSATEVPDFLSALNANESDLERLNRQSVFWEAWLAAVAKAPNASGVVPGESSTGLGHFIRTLAAGQVTYDTLPVAADATLLPDGQQLFHADGPSTAKLLAIAVPYPVGSGTQRSTVRLVNGVNGDGIPAGIVQRVVLGGAQITEIGNARRFGVHATEIHYTDPASKTVVDRLRFFLGGKPTEVFDDTGDDTVQITVVLGADLLDDPPAPLLTGAPHDDG